MRARSFAGVLALLLVLAALAFGMWERRERAHTLRLAAEMVHGNPSLGPDKIRKYGCYACHVIPGVTGANGLVGPALSGIASRVFIAGKLPNSPENITRWIQHPRAVDPHTAMPEMGVTDDDSRDIAAYLYTLQPGR